MADALTLARWRLVLGRFAERGSAAARVGGHEVTPRWTACSNISTAASTAGRGVRRGAERGGSGRPACWRFPTGSIRCASCFPRDTVEVIERHALDRYGMTELVTDAEMLRKLEPSYELLKAVLTFRH